MDQPNQNNGSNPTAQELQNKLDSIFDYVSGGFLTMFEYSDWKVAKGQKLAMDDLLKKFFYIQKAESEAKKTALRIAEQFEINPEVINQLKKLNK